MLFGHINHRSYKDNIEQYCQAKVFFCKVIELITGYSNNNIFSAKVRGFWRRELLQLLCRILSVES